MSNPIFDGEMMEEHEKAYEKVREDIECIAGANDYSIAMVAGYHEENDEYEFAQYAEFGTPEDANYASIAITNYYWALQEIKKLRKEILILKEEKTEK